MFQEENPGVYDELTYLRLQCVIFTAALEAGVEQVLP